MLVSPTLNGELFLATKAPSGETRVWAAWNFGFLVDRPCVVSLDCLDSKPPIIGKTNVTPPSATR